MNSIEKIGKIEAIALMIIIMINQIILNMPTIIISASGNSSVINSIYITILALIFIHIIYRLFKPFENKDLVDISEYVGGKTLKIVVGILYIIFFLLFSTLLFRYFVNNLKLIYFNDISMTFLLIIFLLPPVILNKIGLKSISATNLIFIPISIISLVVLLLAICSDFIPQRIFPILGYGINSTFFSGALNIFSFAVVGYLYFLPPILKSSKDFKSISIISVLISGICLIFSVISILMSLGGIIVTDEMFTIYLLTRLVKFGKFLQRIDAIFIFLWIISLFSLLSFTFYYILTILKKITKIANQKELIYALSAIIFASSLIPKNISNIKYGARIIYKYFNVSLIFGLSLIILILANIKFRKFNK